MSLPPQPPNPPSRGSAPGDSPPRAGARDTGPKPPADSVDEAQTLHTAAEREDEPPQTGDSSPRMPRLGQPPRGKRIRRKSEAPPQTLTAEQRLLLLDTWRRSGLPAGDFAALVGLSKYTLYAWKHKFEAEGPAGLEDKPRGGTRGSRLPEVTKRAILMMKQDNPDWGCEKISALLLRGPALPASPQAVARVLHEAGYQTEESPTRPHPDKVRHFERARPKWRGQSVPAHAGWRGLAPLGTRLSPHRGGVAEWRSGGVTK